MPDTMHADPYAEFYAILSPLTGALDVRVVEDPTEDGLAMIRTDGMAIEAVVVHDATCHGAEKAKAQARLLSLAPIMLQLLSEALDVYRDQFDDAPDVDPHVDGGDVVGWFAEWRLRARHALSTLAPPAPDAVVRDQPASLF